MSEITAIASSTIEMSQTRTLDQINTSVLKMALDAEKDMASRLLENVGQVQESPDSTKGHIDLYV